MIASATPVFPSEVPSVFPRRPTAMASEEQDHPKGALLFILVYLVVLALFWLNAYLRIWRS
jgi:hypothetical protein